MSNNVLSARWLTRPGSFPATTGRSNAAVQLTAATIADLIADTNAANRQGGFNSITRVAGNLYQQRSRRRGERAPAVRTVGRPEVPSKGAVFQEGPFPDNPPCLVPRVCR